MENARARLTAFHKNWRASNSTRLRRVDADTWFWPVMQAGALQLREEEAALGRVFEAVKTASQPGDSEEEKQKEVENIRVDLTSGYFGLYKAYKKAVVNSPAPFQVIAASPKVRFTFQVQGLVEH